MVRPGPSRGDQKIIDALFSRLTSLSATNLLALQKLLQGNLKLP
jgi:hypothetical protein